MNNQLKNTDASLADIASPAIEREAMKQEVCYLHRCLFHRDPSSEIIDRYFRAHEEIKELRTAPPLQLGTVSIVVARQLDAMGIEPWLRGGTKRHILSAKLLLLSYLAESDASHSEFVRCSGGFARALTSMVFIMTSALFRLIHGRLQKTWYGLL